MSDTPRTDAALDELADDQRGAVHYNGGTFIDLARDLERELAWATREKEKLTEIVAARPEVGTINVPLRLVELIREARKDGWYEDNPRWDEVDALLPQGGR